jgi:exopolysaccharide biosynthesis polyprenyl glycosylphosphotransferase
MLLRSSSSASDQFSGCADSVGDMQYTHLDSTLHRRTLLRSLLATDGRPSTWMTIAQIVTDAGLVWISFWVAYQLRYTYHVGGPVLSWDWHPFSAFYQLSALFVLFTIIALTLRGGYRMPRWTSVLDEWLLIVGGITIAMAAVILSTFLNRFFPSRLVFILTWMIAVSLLLLSRLVVRRWREWLWTNDIGVHRVLVVGAGESGRRIMQALQGTPNLGLRVAGFVDDGSEGDGLTVGTERGIQRASRLGSIGDVPAVIGMHDIDEVIIALPSTAQSRTLALADLCRARQVPFKVVPDLLQLSLDRVELAEISGVPLIGMREATIQGVHSAIKRGFDLVLSTLVLFIALIPMGLIALAIKRAGGGPILYRQTRIGRHQVPFTLYKFRCMTIDADQRRDELLRSASGQDSRLFKLPDDPRITGVGRVLRRWSLDELPQVFNVLMGEMSLVGPRPQMPEEVAGYEDWHFQRLLVSPGITGLWQVNGRSDLTFDEMVRLDLYYAEHWSLWLDAKILLRTIPTVLRGRGAY